MLKVNPETNGVMMGPKNPVKPAMPMAVTIAAAASARKGPMKGIAKSAKLAAAPMAARINAACGPNCRKGTPTMTRSTSQSPPLWCTFRLKSAVNLSVPEWLTGIEMVGQFMQILGVQTRPIKGMLTHICGKQKSGSMSLKSNEKVKLREKFRSQLAIRITFGAMRSTVPYENEA